MAEPISTDILICGGGIAGIVTALETLRQGQQVIIVDRDTPERFGGLALWAFGGMALVGTPLQKKMGIPDTPALALKDWLSFGECDTADVHSFAWAKYYVENSRSEVHDWLAQEGIKFMPAVNWVERGRFGDGNSVPRYHVLWGTSRHMTLTLIGKLKAFEQQGKLKIYHQHRISELVIDNGLATGAVAINEKNNESVIFQAKKVVLAMGGINGSPEEVRKNWRSDRKLPTAMLNGAHPFADGKLHHEVAEKLGGQLVGLGEMWNYAAGFPHPFPHFEGHGLSTIPCKSALWLDYSGKRIGPEPLVTGFDTHWLCKRVAEQEKAEQDKPWTWHLLNWRIAAKEFAISGAEHNGRIRDRQFIRFVKELLLGNHRLVKQMQQECPQFIVADTLEELTQKMNALTGTDDVKAGTLKAVADDFDANFANGNKLENDAQIRNILHARQWGPDKLRTCKPAPLQKKGSGPFIAIQMQLITRKSLGGLRTDLNSQVLDANHQPIKGLYCVGEAAGFGGGNSNGVRSLEGTFLPGCILTARAAAKHINNN